jgi:hypothetical protein
MGGNIFWFIPLVAILIGPLIAIFSIWSRMRIREAQIRERIAMIEKGLVPPPEVDPAGFDRAMGRYDRNEWPRRAGRQRCAGVILIGVGVGLAVLIGLADYSATSFREGLAVGGFVAILGLAFLVSSLVDKPREASSPTPPPLNK